MPFRALPAAACLLLAVAPLGAGIVVGRKLPEVEVVDKGVMVPTTTVQGGKMVMAGKEITYRPWKPSDTTGRVRTLYHLAGRVGMDDVNKAYIDAIIAAKLPEFLPDGAYKTITVLNIADALWGTRGLCMSKLEGHQRESPFALFVADEKGVARAAWGLQAKQSAVIILDKDNTVLFFKEGKLTPEEIQAALGIIKDKLK